ncbi:MAG: hypothetical protein WD625_04495, partial [Balneolales bacterium]
WLGWNLGATDAPESSDYNNPDIAGWYFQLNRFQGHYAVAREAPDSDEIIPRLSGDAFSDSDWTDSDPCRELLGDDWRIPTIEEWRSFQIASEEDGGMNSGGKDAAFDSALKLHTTGFVRFFEGIELISTDIFCNKKRLKTLPNSAQSSAL